MFRKCFEFILKKRSFYTGFTVVARATNSNSKERDHFVKLELELEKKLELEHELERTRSFCRT